MQLFYISPSVLPSRSANAVHVVQQCEGFEHIGIKTTLFAKRSLPSPRQTIEAVRNAYGVQLKKTRLVSYYNRLSVGDNVGICLQSMLHVMSKKNKGFILSRNLYASFFLALLKRRPLIFETHQLEFGFRGRLQYETMIRPDVVTVVISKCLLDHLIQHHGRPPARPVVLHDAAPRGIQPLDQEAKHKVRKNVFEKIGVLEPQAVVGYFGHLYEGRGIRIIQHLAKNHPKVGFLVVGGNASDVSSFSRDRHSPNLHFIGHVPHSIAQLYMGACDALLMPYQESVSIGLKGHDTARWMSPLKMFEYLASGIPIISSDLPPLLEVLTDGVNALLVPPADKHAWSLALSRLLDNPELSERIGRKGHQEYAARHTWTYRASSILEAVAG